MNDSVKNIKIAFILNLSFSVFELVGGLIVNSVSVISDALHDFGDALSIGLSWMLDKKSTKKPNQKYTFGYLRFSVLGALINSVILILGSIIMLCNAIPRIISPQPLDYDGLLVLAIIGFAINFIAMLRTLRGKTLSEKVISLHLLEDVLSWALVLICGILMKIFDVTFLDPIVSIGISLFIFINVCRNLKKIFEVFLDKSPSDIDINHVKEQALKNNFIKDIHHVHLWTMDSINKYATVHVLLNAELSASEVCAVKKFVRDTFREFGVMHINIEIEYPFENCDSLECDVSHFFTGSNRNEHRGHMH